MASTLRHGARFDHRFVAGRRTFFGWEAVTQYLTESGVRKTFDFLATAAPRSRLVFTYLREDFIDGIEFYGARALYRQPRVKQKLWHFGLDLAKVSDFLAEYGCREVEQLAGAEFGERYLRPAGTCAPRNSR